MKEKTIWKPMAILLAVILCFSFHFALPVSADYENTHINTGDQATDLVEVARTQVGYHEGTNNYTKYNVWFGSLNGYGYNYAWCQTFVAWCANQAGIPTSMIPRVSGTVSGMDFFKKNGTWKDAGITPEKGDIIYLHSKSSSGYHVGIVADVSGGQISTIEGNSSDRVAERTYSVGNSSIVGYGCPEYVGPDPTPTTVLNVETGNSSTETTFNWNYVEGATEYDIKIWKGTLWDGDAYHIEWGVTSNSWKTILPAGIYQAYIDVRYGDDISMSNTVEFTVKDGCKLDVVAGNASTETMFSWNTVSNASQYDLKVWKNKLWEGDPVFIEWNASNPYSKILSEGTYYAYVDTRFGDDIVISNVVEFTVKNGCKLTVDVGTSSVESVFSWNKLDNINEYDIKVWKNKLWEGDPVFVEWNASNSYSKLLPAGTYYAYVDARGTDSQIFMSNVVEFTVTNGGKLKVDVGDSATKTVFSWNDVPNSTRYDIKIWNGTYWVGDAYHIEWSIPKTDFSIVLPAGHYEAYLDTVVNDDIIMSNIVKFDVTEGTPIPGDLNQDGTLSLTDLIPLQQSLLRQTTLTADEAQLADYNGDGNINVLDLMLLKRALLS